MTTSSQKLLTICFDETDTHGDIPLYEAIVQRLVQLGVAGATVHRGIMGFGPNRLVHRKGLFGVSDDRPIMITVVDKEEKLVPILPELREMVAEGPIYLQDVTVVEG
jgi:uncharacterized protein